MEIIWHFQNSVYYFCFTGCPSSPDHLDLYLSLFLSSSESFTFPCKTLFLKVISMSTTHCCLHFLKKWTQFLIFIFSSTINHPQLTSLTLVYLLSQICAQAKPLLLIRTLINCIYFLPDIIHLALIDIPSSLLLSSLQHQNSLLFIPPATKLWNSLPLHIRICQSLSTLKTLIQPILP